MGGWRAGGEGREMELPQRGDRRGTTGSACRIDSLSSRERYHRMCGGDSELGYLLWRGEGGAPCGETTPPSKSSLCPGLQAALTTGRGRGAAGASHHVSQTGTGVVPRLAVWVGKQRNWW